MSTPCIRICTLDPSGRLCLGCGRTIEEIGAWAGYEESMRLAIMRSLPARLALLARPRPACNRSAPR
ncbi:DUF1289 domain-containing protein [Ancylobacter sp. 6x-1]|uniref:DUF1289 domain-containing protein n=1 Tax=Ancylobacter crimeensis TaxID=2579147 RepID=A0ABT0D8C6_9HYPH|nr:DUF1289 domain-containing protein [Ancylobacter crimeensis]